VIYQQWRDLLFLHWEYSPPALRATLSEGRFGDTFAGQEYVGIVPFFMRRFRPRLLPTVPGLLDFMELNLRTYVYARAGGAGGGFADAPGAGLPAPAPGSLEFFLVERYRLCSHAPEGSRRGAVFHEPYPLSRAKVTEGDEHWLPLNGFAPTGRPPDHVTIFPLERVG